MRRALVATFVTATAVSCAGHKFGLGAGTTYCTPSRYDAQTGGAVDNSGAPFEWTLRSRNTSGRYISTGWSEKRRLQSDHCDRDNYYRLRTTLKICARADGSIESVTVIKPSVSKSFDNKLREAVGEGRYCPFPTGSPQTQLCETKTFSFRGTCD